tara:strand:- start:14179 stop:14373 length:195 start_codon:yes stop_codon:yes gene_type:complete
MSIEIKKTIELNSEIYGDKISAEISGDKICLRYEETILTDELEHFEMLEVFISECRKVIDEGVK